MRKGRITRRKVINLKGRRSVDGLNRKVASKAIIQEESTSGQFLSSDEEEIDLMNQEIISDFSFNSAFLSDYKNTRDFRKVPSHRGRSPSHKYQPKLFQDIVGHEIVVEALSSAIQKEKVAPLYLFHGPSGTGKTSTAKIFSMASNCESTSPLKPCWNCRGCSRSLYITELCSGSRNSGFERIKTLLRSGAFTQKVSGFKVFIIEDCHSLKAEAWGELLSMVERGCGSVVFVMITEDATTVPRVVSSRCQKFCFSKLKETDINMKLERIVAQEGIRIEKDALKLITVKAEGSLREAENILDQLGLLGSRITTCTVQQLVGLVPHNKLIDLLDTAIMADEIKTVRCTRELIASGVEPQALLSQLASLITDILSSTSSSLPTSSKDDPLLRNQARLIKNRSERLCHALKRLIQTEKHLRSSSDHDNRVVAALLQIASENIPINISSNIILPKDIITADEKADAGCSTNAADINWDGLANLIHHRKNRNHHFINVFSEQQNVSASNLDTATETINGVAAKITGKTVETRLNWAQMSDMEEVWGNILGRIQSRYLKEFLQQRGKLISLTVSRVNTIVHLMFKHPEDKLAAEMSIESISKALKAALGSPVTVNVSLEPTQLEVIIKSSSVSTNENQAVDPGHSRQQRSPYLHTSDQPCSSDGRGLVLKRSTSQKSTSASENTSRPTRLQDGIQICQGREECPVGGQETGMESHQQIPPFSGLLTQGSRSDASADPETCPAMRDQTLDKTSITRTSQLKQKLMSISSIQQGDASVEPYSQDLLFEKANMGDRQYGRNKKSKLPKGHHPHSTTHKGLNRSWSCTDIFCRGETTSVKEGTLGASMKRCVLRCSPCKDSSDVLLISTSKKAQFDLRKTMPTSSSS